VLDAFSFLSLFKAYNSNREENDEARQIIDDECKQKRKGERERQGDKGEKAGEKRSFLIEYENEHTIVRIS
jgi:hypothetical protein